MSKIYLPVTITNSNCAYISQRGVIRVFDSRNYNAYVNYTDYYLEDHYISNTGTSYIGNNFNYNCIATSDFTTDFLHRFDLPEIIIIFTFIVIFFIWFPYKIVSRALGRWFKL